MNKKTIIITLCAIIGVLALFIVGYCIGNKIANHNKQESKEEKKKENKKEEKEDNQEEEVKKVTISFDSNGGTEVPSVQYVCGEELTLPEEPTREGYTFQYWEKEDGSALRNKSRLECKDRNIKAIWEKVKSHHCPEGYTLKDTECYKPVSSVPTETCPEGTYESVENGKCYDLNDSKKVKTYDKCNAKEVSLNGEPVVAEGYAEDGKCYYGDMNIDSSSRCSEEKGYWIHKKCWAEKREGVNFGCPDNYGLVIDTYYQFHIQKTLNGSACYPIVPKMQCEDPNAVLTENGCYLIQNAEYY